MKPPQTCGGSDASQIVRPKLDVAVDAHVKCMHA